VSINEYTAYLNNPANGLVQTDNSHSIDLACAYKPTDLFAYQETAAADANAPLAADAAKAQYQGNVYVALSFAKNGQEVENAFLHDEPVHNACLSYLTHYVYQDVALCTATDTIPATASTYSRQYGTARASTVLVMFAKGKTDLSQGFDILYRGDKFNLGTLRFPFAAEALHNIPTLRY
jgi:hypothetical protein